MHPTPHGFPDEVQQRTNNKRSLSGGVNRRERFRLKSRRHEQAWFGGGQGGIPSLTDALSFDIHALAIA